MTHTQRGTDTQTHTHKDTQIHKHIAMCLIPHVEPFVMSRPSDSSELAPAATAVVDGVCWLG